MKNEIRYATLERRPVRLNDHEAWWVINGAWKPLHLAEAVFGASLLTQEHFEKSFPNLPQLPSTAFQTDVVDVPAYVLAARGVYTTARAALSPEWRAVLGDK